MAKKDIEVDIDIDVMTTGTEKAIRNFERLRKTMAKTATPLTPEEIKILTSKVKKGKKKKKEEEEAEVKEEKPKKAKKKKTTKKKKKAVEEEEVEEAKPAKKKTTKKKKPAVKKEEVKPAGKKELTPQEYFEQFYGKLTDAEKAQLGVKKAVEKTTKAEERQKKTKEKVKKVQEDVNEETKEATKQEKESDKAVEEGTKKKSKSTKADKKKREEQKKQQEVLRQATMAELLMGKYQGSRAEITRRLTTKSRQLGKANWSLVSVQMSLLGVFFSTLMLGMYLSRLYTSLLGPLSDLETAIKNTAFAYGLADKMGVDVEGTFGKLDDQVEKTQTGFLRVKFASSFASLALQDVAASVMSNDEVWAKFKEIIEAWKDVAPDVKEAAKDLFMTMLDIILQLIPNLPGILDFLTSLLKLIKPMSPYMAKAMLFAGTFMAILAPIAAGLGGVAFVTKMLAAIIGVSATAITGWIAVAAAAVVAIGYLLHKLGVLKDVIALVVDWFKTLKDWILLMPPGLHTLGFAIAHLTDLWNILKTALENVWNWLGNVRSAISMLTAPLSDLADKLRRIKDLSSFVGGAISGLGTTTVTKPVATSTVTTPIQQSNVITNNIYTPADKDEITDSILKTLFGIGGMLGL